MFNLGRFYQLWQNFVTCNQGITNQHPDYRKAYLVNVMLLAALGVFGLFTLLNITYFFLYHVAILDFIAFVLVLSLLLWFRRSRRVGLASLLTSLVIAIALFGYVALERHHDYSFFWLATFPPFAYFLNGLYRGTLIIALVYLPAYLLLFSGLGAWPAADYTPGAFSNILVASFALAALVYFYEKSRSAAVEQLQKIQAREATEQERNRLLRDMHDGLGSQLTTAVYMARNSKTSVEEIGACVQAALDDLRLMMDSLQTFDGDIATLLGQLRYRLEKRLQAAGLQLLWRVDDLPAFAELTPQDALNLQRCVQEALTNVIKHAQATRVEVAAIQQGQRLVISISDNGQGFDADHIYPGRGLDNLFHRASELGGQLNLLSQAGGGGTRVELILNFRT
ncbi:sensor histidine kinase [Marinospirillum perlucidum]|uniref:sensor histidine kinase n=1 Tax=Marinospirillum perlucidum TaxID=1982602 RepID=UPI000DF1A75B|nr:sensor histidine kinase [Marinospirillum perlucidum]